MFSLDYVMFLTNQVRCYYIIVLLNAILTIVQLSGTSVVSITHIKLKISKKKALRFITMNFNSSYKLLLDDCNKYPLYVARIKRFIELVYKIAHDKCPIYLNDLIKPKNLPINLRSENDMYIPQYKTITYGKHSFIYSIMHHIIGTSCQI